MDNNLHSTDSTAPSPAPLVVFVGGPLNQQYARLTVPPVVPGDGVQAAVCIVRSDIDGYRWGRWENLPFLFYAPTHTYGTAIKAMWSFYAVAGAKLPPFVVELGAVIANPSAEIKIEVVDSAETRPVLKKLK